MTMDSSKAEPDGIRRLFFDLYMNHKNRVARILRYYGVHADAMEDATQEVFAALVRSSRDAGGASIQDPAAYLFQIARNTAITLLRQRYHQTEVSLDGIGADGFEAKPDADAELSDCLLHAMRDMPGVPREVLVYRIFQELSFAQIAAILGLPLGTVTSHYRRGLDHIRQRLGDKQYH